LSFSTAEKRAITFNGDCSFFFAWFPASFSVTCTALLFFYKRGGIFRRSLGCLFKVTRRSGCFFVTILSKFQLANILKKHEVLSRFRRMAKERRKIFRLQDAMSNSKMHSWIWGIRKYLL